MKEKTELLTSYSVTLLSSLALAQITICLKMPNFMVQALFLQALCTSPLWFAFKSWAKEWLLTEDPFVCLYNYCMHAMVCHNMCSLNFESPLSASDIFLQVSCGKYQIDITFSHLTKHTLQQSGDWQLHIWVARPPILFRKLVLIMKFGKRVLRLPACLDENRLH